MNDDRITSRATAQGRWGVRRSRRKGWSYEVVNGLGWEVLLEYEDVFGNAFHTIHRKDPRMPWTECDKGRTPASAV